MGHRKINQQKIDERLEKEADELARYWFGVGIVNRSIGIVNRSYWRRKKRQTNEKESLSC
jgi:hypothetical protein